MNTRNALHQIFHYFRLVISCQIISELVQCPFTVPFLVFAFHRRDTLGILTCFQLYCCIRQVHSVVVNVFQIEQLATQTGKTFPGQPYFQRIK